jgi:hypothetical protein
MILHPGKNVQFFPILKFYFCSLTNLTEEYYVLLQQTKLKIKEFTKKKKKRQGPGFKTTVTWEAEEYDRKSTQKGSSSLALNPD